MNHWSMFRVRSMPVSHIGSVKVWLSMLLLVLAIVPERAPEKLSHAAAQADCETIVQSLHLFEFT